MTAAPIRRRRPQVEVWRQGQGHHRRGRETHFSAPPPPVPSPPPPVETQLAALEAEFRAWGREGLV